MQMTELVNKLKPASPIYRFSCGVRNLPRILKASMCRLVMVLAAWALSAATPGVAKDTPSTSNLPAVFAAELPQEARETLNLIKKGGPFPYAKDGVVFSNREKILPRQPRGFYREYTVKTPGARNRGALRIVCGGTSAAICYFSSDHYQTFRRIKE